jgi:hypothetical protein
MAGGDSGEFGHVSDFSSYSLPRGAHSHGFTLSPPSPHWGKVFLSFAVLIVDTLANA